MTCEAHLIPLKPHQTRKQEREIVLLKPKWYEVFFFFLQALILICISLALAEAPICWQTQRQKDTKKMMRKCQAQDSRRIQCQVAYCSPSPMHSLRACHACPVIVYT